MTDYTAADCLRYAYESLAMTMDWIIETILEHHVPADGTLPEHLNDVLNALTTLNVATRADLVKCGVLIVSEEEQSVLWPAVYSNGVPVYTALEAGISALTHPSGYVPALGGDDA